MLRLSQAMKSNRALFSGDKVRATKPPGKSWTLYGNPVVSQRFSEEDELLVVILHEWRRGKQLIYRHCLEHRQAQDL